MALEQRMERRFQQARRYSQVALQAVDAVRDSLVALSGEYREAYRNYSDVVGAGRAEAQNQNFWQNICVGIGVGILLGVGVAFVFPTTAAGWLAISGGELLAAAGSAGGQALAGGLATTGIAGAIETPGTNLQPTGLDPNVLDMQIWRGLSERYRHAAQTAQKLGDLHNLQRNASYLVGHLRVRRAGGEVPVTPREMIMTLSRLISADTELRATFDPHVTQEIARMQQIRSQANRGLPANYGKRQMEQDIWVMWIASLNPTDEDSHDLLDLDAIEDYLHGSIGVLGRGGILRLDFGDYTSENDERDAIYAARRHKTLIEQRFRRLSGRQEGGNGD